MPPKRGTRKGSKEPTPSTRTSTSATGARSSSAAARRSSAAARSSPAAGARSSPFGLSGDMDAIVRTDALVQAPIRFSVSYGSPATPDFGEPTYYGTSIERAVTRALGTLKEDEDELAATGSTAGPKVGSKAKTSSKTKAGAKTKAGSKTKAAAKSQAASQDELDDTTFIPESGPDDDTTFIPDSGPDPSDMQEDTPRAGLETPAAPSTADHPTSDAPPSVPSTGRSYIEESSIFGKAALTTPAAVATTEEEAQRPSTRAQSHSPSRRSNRIAARAGSAEPSLAERFASLKERLKSRAEEARKAAAIDDEDEPTSHPTHLRIVEPADGQYTSPDTYAAPTASRKSKSPPQVAPRAPSNIAPPITFTPPVITFTPSDPPQAGRTSHAPSSGSSGNPFLPTPSGSAAAKDASSSKGTSGIAMPDLSKGDPSFGKSPAAAPRVPSSGLSSSSGLSPAAVRRRPFADDAQGVPASASASASANAASDQNGSWRPAIIPPRERAPRPPSGGASTQNARRRAAFAWLKGLIARILLAITTLLLGWIAFRIGLAIVDRPARYHGTRIIHNLKFYGWTDLGHNLAQFVPSVVRNPSLIFRGRDQEALADILNTQHLRIHSLELQMDASNFAIRELQSIVPTMVNVKAFWNGEFKIPEEFWHALRNKMVEDSIILTLEESPNGTLGISDQAWQSIKQRFDASGYPLSGGKDGHVAGDGDGTSLTVERIAEHVISQSRSWDAWVRENERKIQQLLADAVDHDDSPLSRRIRQKWRDDVETIMSERLKKSGLGNIVVTKQEFLEQLTKEVEAHRRQIKGQLRGMHDRIEQAVANAQAAIHTAYPPAGIDQREVKKLVDKAVRKALADFQLESIAKGQIKAHYDDVLRSQLNYLHIGSGAVVDQSLLSPTYQPPRDKGGWRQKGGAAPDKRRAYAPLEPWVGLSRWEEDGECWCGQANSSGAVNFAAYAADRVIPQHLVVEHIAAGATFRPDATPRDLELWARIETQGRQKRVREWSSAEFPGTARDDPLLAQGFLKIGQFTFQRAAGAGGAGAGGGGGGKTADETQVFRLSEQLVGMDAQTTRIVVRAASNWGADHTCFYRVRLYGEKPEHFDEYETPISTIGAKVGSSWWS